MKEIKNQYEFDLLVNEGITDFSNYIYLDIMLFCKNKNLLTLPQLPVCKALFCDNNNLTELPDLPACEQLYCTNNNLKNLPDLPVCKVIFRRSNVKKQ